MCGTKSKNGLRNIGVILLLLLVVLSPIHSLTAEETARARIQELEGV